MALQADSPIGDGEELVHQTCGRGVANDFNENQ
jgi:hypothetical protein